MSCLLFAGNLDGSADALLNGQLGQLVNPASGDETSPAIKNILENKSSFHPNRNLLMKHFSYEAYTKKLSGTINQGSSKNLVYA